MPVIVFYGDEDYLIEQAAKQLRDTVVNPAMASLCHRVYSQPSLATALEAIGSVSLALGGQTLIELRDFSFLYQASKDASTDAQLTELKTLLEEVDASKTVLFLSSKVDGKIKFAKWLTQHAHFQAQKFERFKFWETDKAADFLVRDTKSRGITLLPDAAELLVNLLGTELRLLNNEIAKLQLYALDRPITEADVLKISNHSDNLFQLIQRWLLQQGAASNFHDLNEIFLKRHPIEIFATVQSYFNNIFRAVWLNARGLSPDAIARQTGQKPFSVKKNLSTFRQVPLQRWIHLKHLLVDLEWKTKTGQLDGQLALEMLLGA